MTACLSECQVWVFCQYCKQTSDSLPGRWHGAELGHCLESVFKCDPTFELGPELDFPFSICKLGTGIPDSWTVLRADWARGPTQAEKHPSVLIMFPSPLTDLDKVVQPGLLSAAPGSPTSLHHQYRSKISQDSRAASSHEVRSLKSPHLHFCTFCSQHEAWHVESLSLGDEGRNLLSSVGHCPTA